METTFITYKLKRSLAHSRCAIVVEESVKELTDSLLTMTLGYFIVPAQKRTVLLSLPINIQGQEKGFLCTNTYPGTQEIIGAEYILLSE